MKADPKKLETEQLRGIIEWPKEHIMDYLILIYGWKLKEVRQFQSECKKELKNRDE